MKTWEETIKLKKLEKIRIILYILNAILDFLIGIVGNNFAWIICSMLWIAIGILEYSYLKINKGNETIIDTQEKCIKTQESIIDALMSETAVEVEIDKIKIPKHFSKPNPEKLQVKFKYYRENHKFASQIVIDLDYNLLDGYTSYLIAKHYNKKTVIVKLKNAGGKNARNI